MVDNVDFLLSVELSVSDLNKDWTDKIFNILSDRSNWSLKYIECPPIIIESNINVQSEHHPVKDTLYEKELKDIVDPFISERTWDLVFVDCGIHHRGNIVNYCMEREIPIIVAHDTNHQTIYGYNLV